MKSHFYFLAFVCSALILSGCSAGGILTGMGATTGIAATQEGGLSRAATDLRIQAMINDKWFKYDVDTFSKLDMTVNQGRVLLTGVVQNPEHRVEAVRLAWQVEGVTQVINEIRLADEISFTSSARDAWISARLRMALTFDRDVDSLNYSIDTVQGSVYLMGVAQNQAELNRVVETARTIPDVRQVVSYVKMLAVPVPDVKGKAVPPKSTKREMKPIMNEHSEYETPAYDSAPEANNNAGSDRAAPPARIYDDEGLTNAEPVQLVPLSSEPITVPSVKTQPVE